MIRPSGFRILPPRCCGAGCRATSTRSPCHAVCPLLYLHLFLNDDIPEEHKSGIDMSRDMLRRAHVLVVCGNGMTEDVKNDIAVAGRLNITATTLDGILTVKGKGREARCDD